ncbi:stage VI sporulation protein D [Ectobacillus sp. JY-23]|uniref:stage VI sporulation protein D n=1 Tax=Ectobacillus sp. JY-23 TaxID=2933872 RepID=UPI001FF48EB0|nr:stage VI sporulation protein D [Ectobacillus sp. JY-23]UOY94167.1 stage VI sporulation protein D [Ectobacillus sp. JY-23]
MTLDEQTSLRFSLKESIWFKKGQEVAELISISLDPDISVQEKDYEVVVRGELQLTGEYVPEPEEEGFSLRDLSPVRTVDAVFTREDGVNEISHAFPLEVSIPRARVRDAADLYVTIESFDYELPERGCLQLIADIAIGGLCNRDEVEVHHYEESQENEWDSYYDEDAREEDTVYEAPHFEELTLEPFQLEAKKPPAEEVPPAFSFQKFRDEEEEETYEYSQRDENALYLTKLFTKERDEEFTKMRMYFVQQGDTTESIAEKYNITSQQLTRVNQIDEGYLQEGKILYIPIVKPKAKS